MDSAPAAALDADTRRDAIDHVRTKLADAFDVLSVRAADRDLQRACRLYLATYRRCFLTGGVWAASVFTIMFLPDIASYGGDRGAIGGLAGTVFIASLFTGGVLLGKNAMAARWMRSLVAVSRSYHHITTQKISLRRVARAVLAGQPHVPGSAAWALATLWDADSDPRRRRRARTALRRNGIPDVDHAGFCRETGYGVPAWSRDGLPWHVIALGELHGPACRSWLIVLVDGLVVQRCACGAFNVGHTWSHIP